MSKANIEEYGWTAVPRNRSNIPSESDAKTTAIQVDFEDIWPTTGVVRKVQEHVKQTLPQETYNHSLRVYCYGYAMVTQHFQSWFAIAKDSFFETWALTCLFHDIGTTLQSRDDTHMSFEFQGGFMALQQLQSFGAPKAQAESVCEAIIRHQDPGENGTISRVGQLVQIATEYGEYRKLDVTHRRPFLDLVTEDTDSKRQITWATSRILSIRTLLHRWLSDIRVLAGPRASRRPSMRKSRQSRGAIPQSCLASPRLWLATS